MKLFKRNQIIIYVIALMLMTAGYLNYSTGDDNSSVETSVQMESNDDTQLADIGDATLVSSNDVVDNSGNSVNQGKTSEDTNQTAVNQVEDNKSLNETGEIAENVSKQSNKTNDNILNNSDKINTQETNSKSVDYFVQSKLERDTMYSQMIDTYEKILNSSNSSETQKQSATQEIGKINDTKNSIMICENLIKTKGFDNSVVFVNDGSINVIIGATELTTEQVAQIQDIISREMKAEIENIRIMVN